VVIRASDILLTRNAYKIEPGWVCRAEPGSGVGDVPSTRRCSFPLEPAYRSCSHRFAPAEGCRAFIE
jgi:hypothetical protein